MRKLFAVLLVFLGVCAAAQNTYNNEWIDYTKTYYRFRVGKDGVYRIPASTLAAAGLGAASAQEFQLWRNGVQVPIYTSVASGALGANDFIEFWGKMNDGKPDRELFREPGFHYNDRWSLISDSATYFLTVSSTGANFRFQPTPNNVAGNTLPAEPYFMHKTGLYFKDKVNSGLFYVVGSEHLFSSSYDKGEGWTSPDIARNATLTNTIANLFPATTGPAPTISAVVTGNAYNPRRYKVSVNGDSVLGNLVPYMNESKDTAAFNLNLLSSGNAAIAITNLTEDCGTSNCPTDRMVAHRVEITYPRQFNFGNATNFEFSLPASATGNYLEIAGFSDGGVAPVLYDLTNGRRYVAEMNGSQVRVVLQPSATARNLVLVSYNTAQISAVASLQQRNFVNYNLAQNQANYLIISNPLLFNGASGSNPVEEYRAYRESAQGGSYNAKIFLEEQLIDQFGFGIRKNPAGIRNFIRFARHKFAAAPKFVYIIGRGVHYLHQRSIEATGTAIQKSNLEKLNMIPTFGWPASDMLLAAEPGVSSPAIPIGRLTAITPEEVSTYLKKVKDYELAQQTLSPSIGDKAWMKNIAHIAGAGEKDLAESLTGFLNGYKRIIEDTLYGAKVTTFTKTSTSLVQQLSDQDLTNLFNQGLSLITYYGHSSPTTLEFNLDDPANYNNQGKYPMFLALGCNAGNTFDFNENRFVTRNYLSDKYVLAPERGSINFIASTHFGIVHYLDIWNIRAYRNMATYQYQGSIGEIMKKTIEDVNINYQDDFFARCNAEETILNGDPAVRLNQQAKPDYAITDSMLKVSPNFISVADLNFKVDISVMNLGKAINRPVVVETKRRYPDGTEAVVRRDTLSGTRYRDVLSFLLPIDATKDKGTNTIFVKVDADEIVDEHFETNNSTSREFFIFEDEIRPIYPYDYSIVNNQNITLKASTANPFSPNMQYQMEIDTTERFDSPLKVTRTQNSAGGSIEFQPGLTFQNNTVYYWRVAPVPTSGTPVWKNSSFIYIANSSLGYNQSHYYQFQKSTHQNLKLDGSSRTWLFDSTVNSLMIKNGVFPTASGQEADYAVSINGNNYIRSACVGFSLIFNVIDPNTFKPLANPSGFMNSGPYCLGSRLWNFEYSFQSRAARKDAMDFMDWIPNGSYVVVRNITGNGQSTDFVDTWKADTAAFGSGNSLYHKLKAVGLEVLDQYTSPKAWAIVYQKNVSGFMPVQGITAGMFDLLTMSATAKSPDSIGYITSPAFGPAKTWKEFQWQGTSVESPVTDAAKVHILGVKTDGKVDTLIRNISMNQGVTDISSINANQYPFVQLVMRNIDSVNFSPYQLKHWRLTYDPVPEGVVSPNVMFSMKDTFDVGEPLNFKLAFKNISDASFEDSMKIKVIVYDRANTQRVIPLARQKSPKAPGEVATVQFELDTKQLVGSNTLFVDINPDNDQLEQHHFNNFIFKNFYVVGDTLNPVMDVTFDNVHILNQDIVSSKPTILMKLKDEAKWMLLDDPSKTTVQIRYPDSRGILSSNSVTKTFNFNSDTLRFIPASGAPNADNTASIEFRPFFEADGEYELIVSAKDMSENTAGAMSYRVAFRVINKAMISNMLNYPNPFTTSTAFVFTLTGSEVPQNMRIQILTVTGKIVREITKDELGPLRIGRNITEFKWDGTDQYGQKLANGVYLYRVITNLNGKSLEKYTSGDDNTDKFFNRGYGKMYLMR
ncbi:MAG TPA: C25 family cysteine peptidase [Flavisolibacter sp.]|nr:C25 family cysteine peptidase [Flavisolibacter sp.]